ncbi:MAG: ABC transporter ATP-binding protein/permease [Lachnospiraceae bacterium]|nr:ABC transporter ATP-binding protein/permease [Lachnospiraceae bacterium]
MKEIIKYFEKREKFFFIMVAFLSTAQIWLDLAIPQYMNQITTLLNSGADDINSLSGAGIAMLVCAFVSVIVAGILGYFSARIGAGIACRLREAVFHKTLSFSLEELKDYPTASLITRCTNDITRIQSTFTSAPPILFRAPVTAILAIMQMGFVNMAWTIDTTVLVFIMIVVCIWIMKKMRPWIFRMQSRTDDLNRVTREHLTGLKVIHAFGSYDYQMKRAQKVNDELGDAIDKGQAYYALVSPFLTAVSSILSVSIYIIGAYLILHSDMPSRIGLFSDMVMFSSYVMLVVAAFSQIAVVYTSIANTTASVDRVTEVLLTDIRITDGKESEAGSESEDGSIEFRNVNFKYSEKGGRALKDLNFRIDKGQTVAIVGATGCGKTSVLNLIPRLYEATEGEVFVGGRNVKDYKLKDLRGMIGYVPQRSILFSGTIAQNVDYGDNGRFRATLKEIKDACEVGQAKEFIEKKEGDYNARVSRDGSNFSGGQKQRLSISRAICRDPKIYLFDDSFSALDFQTDKRLRAALRKTAQGATVVIVAQRIGTIRGADKILVMDQGAIVGEGTHEELLRSCQVYKEIALSQLSGEEVSALETASSMA